MVSCHVISSPTDWCSASIVHSCGRGRGYDPRPALTFYCMNYSVSIGSNCFNVIFISVVSGTEQKNSTSPCLFHGCRKRRLKD
jgi:hypothetical protein